MYVFDPIVLHLFDSFSINLLFWLNTDKLGNLSPGCKLRVVDNLKLALLRVRIVQRKNSFEDELFIALHAELASILLTHPVHLFSRQVPNLLISHSKLLLDNNVSFKKAL